MMVEDFSIEKDDDGVEFITFSEGLTKTNSLLPKCSLQARRGASLLCLSST